MNIKLASSSKREFEFVNELDNNGPINREFSWTHGDINDMLEAAASNESNLYERHFLLEKIVAETYGLRKEETYRKICIEYAEAYLNEFPKLVSVFKKVRGRSFPNETFKYYAIILTENGEFEKAIQVCEKALEFKLHDGTLKGFKGRIAKIRNKAKKGIVSWGVNSASTRDTNANKSCQRSLVPLFRGYPSTKENMDRKQRQFYNKWLQQWEKRTPLEVCGNISYLLCYTYELLHSSQEKATGILPRLIEAYPSESKFLGYCKRWLSDCYVLQGEYQKALDMYPTPPISASGAIDTDNILTLKLKVGKRISGYDLLSLNGPNVTEWGKKHLKEIIDYLDIYIGAYEKYHNTDLLKEWKNSTYKYTYYVFKDTGKTSRANIRCYSFRSSKPALKFIKEITREAENSIREEKNIPRVGEGWIGETELYYAIKQSLPKTEVIQHARPDWLGRQHLDVFIPEYSVALEYQGAQHDEPVEYFGGKKAYLQTKKRDARKKLLCEKNKVLLIEVRPGYVLQEILRKIHDKKVKEDEYVK